MSDQPLPRPGGEDVTPVAHERFVALLAEREQRGIATYGRTLQTHNGRDCHLDLAEELVDAFQYATQAMLERRDLEAERDRLRADLDECGNQLGGADAEARWSMEQRRAAEQRAAEAEEQATQATGRFVEAQFVIKRAEQRAAEAEAKVARLESALPALTAGGKPDPLKWEALIHQGRYDLARVMRERDDARQQAAEAEGLTERLTARIVEAAAPLMAGYVNADDAFACLDALAAAATVVASLRDTSDASPPREAS